MNDSVIIRLMKSKPDKGIYEAISKYEGLIRAVAARILTNEQDIDECVSDSFVDVWKHISDLRADDGSLKGYLICIVRNNAISRYRQNARDKSTPQSDVLDLFEYQLNMEDRVLENADIQTMLELIDHMEEPDREILIRKHLLFEQSTDIAQRLDMKPNQVKYRLQRAKEKLRENLIKKGVAL